MEQMVELARSLVAQESKRDQANEQDVPLSFIVIDKVRPQLCTLMGMVGFRALLARSLSIACLQVSWLSEVQVTSDGSLQLDHVALFDAVVLLEGGTVLLGQLLGLLATFIGEPLTRRIVDEIWPALPRNETAMGEDSHERQA